MDRQKSPPKKNVRKLRDRKERKFYTDGDGEVDDDFEGPQSFDLEEKLETPRFNKPLVKELRGVDFNLSYIQQHGFTTPLLFRNKEGLGIRIPGQDFSVNDVRTCVGSKRLLDVMDVRTQKNLELTMKQWQEYYDNPERDRLLNVISLEFSHTKLENYVESPTVVRQLDWVDRVWPRHLKNMQTESTNVMDEMMYPKVQKYCLMSVKGCYTDFHVDFGGTSVWYHILKGQKVFWLIPPTDKNLDLYQAWVLSGKQGDTFFADNVEDCGRVLLGSGDTFMIPSGWIHAVYTPADSLVFGGNFLHSFGIDKQLKIAMVEEATKVPQKFRYPFYTEMLWYTLERYVHCLLGRTYIRIPNDDDEGKNENSGNPISNPLQSFIPQQQVHLSPQELLGLKAIVMYLHQLPIARKNVPALIYDPVALLREIRTIVEEHRFDSPEKAVTGQTILVWPGEKPSDVGKVQDTKRKRVYKQPLPTTVQLPTTNNWVDSTTTAEEEAMKRRVRCGFCQPCLTKEDCKSCFKCLSTIKPKDKSPSNRGCVMRECLMPTLQPQVVCGECGLDGWDEKPGPSKVRVAQSNLMECIICYQITHPKCLATKLPTKIVGIVNDDSPQSWQCPVCLHQAGITTKSTQPDDRRTSLESKNGSTNGTCVNSSFKNANPIPGENISSTNNVNNLSGLKSGSSTNKQGEEIQKVAIKTESPDIKIEPSTTTTTISSENNNISNSKKLMSDRKMREDEKTVQQKMALAVRRKSLEEGLVKIPTKNKPNSDPLKSKLPTSLPEQGKRRNSEDKGKTTENKNSTSGSSSVSDGKKEDKSSPNKELLMPKKEPPEESEESEQEEPEDQKKQVQSPIKYPFRTELSNKIMNGSSKTLKRPFNVVRPAILNLNNEESDKDSTPRKRKKFEHLKDVNIMIPVFKWLDVPTLNRCLSVCKDWNRVIMTPILWKRIDLSHFKITADLLKGCVRRQPTSVSLNWTGITKQQLLWFISRLPQLKELSLQGVPWTSVCALKTCMCPTLASLDLGYVGSLTDAALREILAPPIDSRPGLTDSKSRLRQLKSLNLSGASLSDVALRYVSQHAGSIAKLELSTCSRITDAGIAQLGAPDSPSLENLIHLNISGCPQLTNISLDHLRRCKNLKYLDIRNINQITPAGLQKFMNNICNNRKIVVESDHKLVGPNSYMNMLNTGPPTMKSNIPPAGLVPMNLVTPNSNSKMGMNP